MHTYRSLPEFSISYLWTKEVESYDASLLLLKKYNIPIHYMYIDNEWKDYHLPPVILTNKTSVKISLLAQDDQWCLNAESDIINKYNISSLINIKELCFIHLNIDIWEILFEYLD